MYSHIHFILLVFVMLSAVEVSLLLKCKGDEVLRLQHDRYYKIITRGYLCLLIVLW